MNERLEPHGSIRKDDEASAVVEGEVVSTKSAGEKLAVEADAIIQNRETLERLLGLNIDLAESPERKLDKLQDEVIALSDVAVNVSLELYNASPKDYQAAIVTVEKHLQRLEVLLVTFAAAIDTDYPKVTLLQKLAVVLIAIIRGGIRESTVMRTIGDTPAKRQALLTAKNGLSSVINKQTQRLETVKEQVSNEIERQIRLIQEDILANDREYKELVSQCNDISHDYNLCEAQKFVSKSGEINSAIQKIYEKYFGSQELNAGFFGDVNQNMVLKLYAELEPRRGRLMAQIERYQTVAWDQAQEEFRRKAK